MMARFAINFKHTGKTLFSTENEREVYRWLEEDFLGNFVIYDSAADKTFQSITEAKTGLRERPVITPNRDNPDEEEFV